MLLTFEMSAVEALKTIEPVTHRRVMDLVQEAGVSIDDWVNFKKGPNKDRAASNPKYCYDWAFVENGKVVVLNLWFDSMRVNVGSVDMLYVGEGDPIRPRLESHYAQKDFWTRAIGFTTTTAGQLNKAHVQFLESRLVALARAAKRMPLDNANQPAEPSLSEADRADMEVFLGHMLGMLPVLGVHAFEQAPKAPAAKAGPVLTCKGKGVQATGYEASQGFVVRAGSQAVADTVPSMAQHVRGMFDLRQELISNGVLAMQGGLYQFTQDYSFSAPSTAAAVVLGRSANGRVEWKAADGRTLKEIQEAEAGQ